MAVQENFLSWQALQPNSGPGGDFYEFCDALEVKNGVSAGASGWGLDNALQAWGNYWKSKYYSDSEHFASYKLHCNSRCS